MKAYKILTLTALIFGISITSIYAQKKEISKEMTALLESKNYKIEVDRMNPMKGASRHLTSSYAVTLNGDSVDSYLPYQGVAYSAPYGGGSALIFESPIKDYTQTFDKKGAAVIKFKATTPEDTYTYYIKIFSNGSSSIQISANKRQGISFSGTLESISKEPK